MIKLKIFVFLMGTAIISCEVLKTSPYAANTIVFGKPRIFPRNKHLSEMRPFHNSFIQQGTNLFYKPQFMTGTTHIRAPFVSEKEININQRSGFLPHVLQNAPGIIMSQPIEINSFPETPEYIIPVAPGRAQVINYEEHETSLIPEEINLQPLPELPNVVFEESFYHKPSIVEERIPTLVSEVPEAPALPAFVMPEIPEIVEPAVALVPEPLPCNHIQIEDSETFLEVPTAPELLPLPAIFPITISETPEPAPIIIEEVIPYIPEAPVLPSFVMPELPEIVEHVVPMVPETPMPLPCEHLSIEELHIPAAPELSPIMEVSVPVIVEESVLVPDAPLLPTFLMPELPSLETLTASELFPTAILTPEDPIEIPEAPLLPSLPLFQMPVSEIKEIETPILSEPNLVEVHSEQPCDQIEIIAESKPVIEHHKHHSGFLPYPVFYAQNIIIERVVPNMIFNSEKIPVNTLPYFRSQAVPIIEES